MPLLYEGWLTEIQMKKTIKAQQGVVVIEVTDDDGKTYWEVWKNGALVDTFVSEPKALEKYDELIQPSLPYQDDDTSDDDGRKNTPTPDPFG